MELFLKQIRFLSSWRNGNIIILHYKVKPFILSFLQKMVIGPGGQLITRITQEAENDLMNIFLRNVRLKISAKLQKWGSQFRRRRSEPDAHRGIRKHEKWFKSEEMDLNWKSVICWVIMCGWSQQTPPHFSKLKYKLIKATLHGFLNNFSYNFNSTIVASQLPVPVIYLAI